MKAIGTIIIAAGMLAGAAGASAAGREEVAFKINTADVNFADPVSVANFRRDVSKQIATVCNPGDRINADVTPDFKCRKEMTAALEPRIQYLVARATGRNFAAN
ncbi:MAG TPA: UrcA family protein [Sphingomonadaceae bacterium]|nr:UrcA family protein [Sphingomonadaceae bacterium]